MGHAFQQKRLSIDNAVSASIVCAVKPPISKFKEFHQILSFMNRGDSSADRQDMLDGEFGTLQALLNVFPYLCGICRRTAVEICTNSCEEGVARGRQKKVAPSTERLASPEDSRRSKCQLRRGYPSPEERAKTSADGLQRTSTF